MENGEFRCPLRGYIEIISEGNTIILNSTFSILHSKILIAKKHALLLAERA